MVVPDLSCSYREDRPQGDGDQTSATPKHSHLQIDILFYLESGACHDSSTFLAARLTLGIAFPFRIVHRQPEPVRNPEENTH